MKAQRIGHSSLTNMQCYCNGQAIMKYPMLKRLGLMAGTAALGLYPAATMAAPISDEQAAALLSKLEKLELEVADLKAQLGTVQQNQVASTSAIAATDAKLAATEEKWLAARSRC